MCIIINILKEVSLQNNKPSFPNIAYATNS